MCDRGSIVFVLSGKAIDKLKLLTLALLNQHKAQRIMVMLYTVVQLKSLFFQHKGKSEDALKVSTSKRKTQDVKMFKTAASELKGARYQRRTA